MTDRNTTWARRWVYRMGFRPKEGSFLFSPSLHPLYSVADVRKNYDKAISQIREREEADRERFRKENTGG